MYNYILLSKIKRKKHKLLHFVGESVLTGEFIYEILLDKVEKNIELIKQLRCRRKKILTDHEKINMHVSVLQMKNTINIYDPFNYKER